MPERDPYVPRPKEFWRESALEAWRRLPEEIQTVTVAFLRARISSEDQEKIRNVANDPDWFSSYHFHWGMSIRNLLRDVVKDDSLPASPDGYRNWDDYYVPVVEVAVQAGCWRDLRPGERI